MSKQTTKKNRRSAGFNPCFHGSTTVRYSKTFVIAPPSGFQSLFSWKYNCESASRAAKTTGREFQSLFSWKYNCE
ncbi:Uncharacterized protein dnl_30400 [Desulfonema limicola]|uniref:Uncharacterized protein n=1 Tax=Desulfonema limicola TaxID=45656 RepID=A0A975GGY4_9BACT|nr:Uncharacterized protein dnl_30400 [Desulfonema limicola]